MHITPRNPSLVPVVLALCACASSAAAQDLQRGTIVDPVQCADDPAQTYALYLPSTYSPGRTWSLLLAFHPAARGRLMAEKYRAAAEQYGYIIAASNNARNGPHAISAAAAQAMGTDVSRRFAIDPQRIYLTGMSGGARVALGIALANPSIAGVVALERRGILTASRATRSPSRSSAQRAPKTSTTSRCGCSIGN